MYSVSEIHLHHKFLCGIGFGSSAYLRVGLFNSYAIYAGCNCSLDKTAAAHLDTFFNTESICDLAHC